MNAIRKYSQVSRITMSNNFVYIWNFLSKNVFFVFIMFIYFMLWKNIYGQKGSIVGGFSLNQMIWYLVVTELVTLSRTEIHFQISEEVKTGNIAYQLTKPYNYVMYCFSYFVGEFGIRLITNGLIGLIIGFVFVGGLGNFNIINFPFILISIILGCFINFFVYISLALSAFWFEDNNPFFWIYSKLVFTLGGMLMPLELFPKWLQGISKSMPFAYVTYAPARLAVNFSYSAFISQIVIQILYLGVFFILALLLYRRGARNLNVNGG